jgi:hypothetical protein
LRDLMMHLQHDAEDWEQAEHGLRALGGETRSPIDPGLTWLLVSAAWPRAEDEYRLLEGSQKREVPLDRRGMFPGTQAP